MTIIETQRNRVYTYEPQPDDVLVRVGWAAHGDGRHLRTIVLPFAPISEYNAAVSWAVGIADKMAYPIHVVTLNMRDMRAPGRFKSFCDAVASMTDQEHEEMRQLLAASYGEAMRDSSDGKVRADAYDALVELGIFVPMCASIQ